MATYPSREQVAKSLTPEELDNLVTGLHSYDRQETVFSLTLPAFSPDVMNAAADLSDAILQHVEGASPMKVAGNSLTMTREKPYDELVEVALSKEANHRYNAEMEAEKAAKDAE